jgi:hypothetical protein
MRETIRWVTIGLSDQVSAKERREPGAPDQTKFDGMDGARSRVQSLTMPVRFECAYRTYIRSIHQTRNIAMMAPAM